MACLENNNTVCKAYNNDSDRCIRNLPIDISGAVKCHHLNFYETTCNSILAGSGKGTEDMGCAYRYDNRKCVDV